MASYSGGDTPRNFTLAQDAIQYEGIRTQQRDQPERRADRC